MAIRQECRPAAPLLALGGDFTDPVEAAVFPARIERFWNERAAEALGLAGLDAAAREAHFARFEPFPGSLPGPLALRYHGHQFRTYNPDLGDGRGFSFAQFDCGGTLRELGTKGSGTTPWSRSGDGRLTLKGGVREVLASEMLEALGVATSKSLALFETGEALVRGDEPSPTRSAVLTRLGRGHIRIGTFQRLAYREDAANIEKLARWSLVHLFGEVAPEDKGEVAARLFALAAEGTARLAASLIAAGFVHGVLNSDNINVTGECFDYGPWRFTPRWDEAFVAAYFDHHGLYAFGRQPEAIHWDLGQLGGCLATIGEREALGEIHDAWPDRFSSALVTAMRVRLGLSSRGEAADRETVSALLAGLRLQTHDIDRVFFDWRGGRRPGGYDGAEWDRLRAALPDAPDEAALAHPYWDDAQPCSMGIDEVEAIWGAIADRDDWQPFADKIAAIRRMGGAMTPFFA